MKLFRSEKSFDDPCLSFRAQRENNVSRKGAKGAKVRNIDTSFSLRAWRLGGITFFVTSIGHKVVEINSQTSECKNLRFLTFIRDDNAPCGDYDTVSQGRENLCSCIVQQRNILFD